VTGTVGDRGSAEMGFLKRGWFRIFISGFVLLYLVERVLVATGNPNYIPSVILLGAFLVPVTFVTYLYERLPEWEIPLPSLAVCFFWGGVLGTVVAGTLEYDVARTLGFVPKLFIGLIEEGAKLILPLVFYFLGRYRSEAAGIVLGVATAMGFAALETMGYGFVTLLQSKGNLGALDEVLLIRGLTSPAGHAAWTGIVCAVLWRERIKTGHAKLNWRIGGAFLTAVILHALWDTFASVRSTTFAGFLGVGVLSLLVALVSLTLLIRRVREARRADIVAAEPRVV
ncbi:MAG TPA: PrsW family intramembrane metalloprotease, partial [Rubrobacteraceae bacterium]|nr:PrsW family intramembrane metalloprotease [Rubrobacteraceae bacterium]